VVKCPSLHTPYNGNIKCSAGEDGVITEHDTCTFTCNNGYKLQGSGTRTCQKVNHQLQWTGVTAQCTKGMFHKNIMQVSNFKGFKVYMYL